jgi:hypothetical protein
MDPNILSYRDPSRAGYDHLALDSKVFPDGNPARKSVVPKSVQFALDFGPEIL